MKAIITAAGLGERLGELTKDTNKCLLKIGEKPLIIHLVDELKSLGVDPIYVVTGHCADRMQEELAGKVILLSNPEYATTGLLSSVIKGKKYLIGSDFLVMTGDSLLHPKIIERIIKTKGQVLASIDLKKCDQEDFKAIIKDDKIIRMSKNLPVEQATGEFTALVKVSKEASGSFFEEIEKFIKDGSQKKYIADIVMLLQKRGFEVSPVYTGNLPRIEIDFPEDLKKAQEIHKEFKSV